MNEFRNIYTTDNMEIKQEQPIGFTEVEKQVQCFVIGCRVGHIKANQVPSQLK